LGAQAKGGKNENKKEKLFHGDFQAVPDLAIGPDRTQSAIYV
jgi:hypothetical protein